MSLSLSALPFVVDDALTPDPAQRRVVHSRKNRRVLRRDAALVFVAVERLGLDLAAIQASVVQQRVERVLAVGQARIDCTQ